ncbi:hypothetical protein RF11_09894 [Thelohanellus kitauei]|uniref:Uncharacterized protein n=1 Tax=Thelohanellus kitauei TaxID=669202 RepID=A0A0C2MI51_THEKT|nr:hypothetical protein RF11_09894 [Thelohanellus kitauei]
MEALHLQSKFYVVLNTITQKENSILTCRYNTGLPNRFLEIKCKSLNQEDEIEISECVISTQRDANDPVIETPIRHKFKFNKKTKYEFRKHYIHLKHDDNNEQKLRFRIYALIITFPGYTKKFCFNYERLSAISVYFTGTMVVDDFGIFGGTYSNESDPSVPIKTDQKDGDVFDELKGDTTHEIDRDTSDDTNRDKSDQINPKKGFWTSKNIVVMVVSFVTIILSVLIIIITLRFRKSTNSTKN